LSDIARSIERPLHMACIGTGSRKAALAVSITLLPEAVENKNNAMYYNGFNN
jgi:hypothetical protein